MRISNPTGSISAVAPKQVKTMKESLSLLPAGQIPWSWAGSPCEASPRGADQGCWRRRWGEAGGTTLPGPAGQTAKVGCLSPTPQGPPILPSGRGPDASWHTSYSKIRAEHFLWKERHKFLREEESIAGWRAFSGFVDTVSHLDAVLGPLLQVRNNRVVPKVDEPRSELIHRDWAGQEKARAWGDTGGERTYRTRG